MIIPIISNTISIGVLKCPPYCCLLYTSYMCGPGPMSKAVEKMLDDLGVPAQNLMFDNFGG